MSRSIPNSVSLNQELSVEQQRFCLSETPSVTDAHAWLQTFVLPSGNVAFHLTHDNNDAVGLIELNEHAVDRLIDALQRTVDIAKKVRSFNAEHSLQWE